MSEDEAGEAESPPALVRTRVRVRRRSRRRKRKRLGLILVLGVGGLFLLGLIWVAVTAFLARERLNDLQTKLAAVKQHALDGNLPALRADAKDLADTADSADFLTSGPAWWFAANVPWAGDPFESVRGITASVDTLAHTSVPQLVDLAQNLNPKTLRGTGGRIDVAAIQRSQPGLARSLSGAEAIRRDVQGLPDSTWLGTVDAGRTKLLTKLNELVTGLDDARRAAAVLPTMLGATTPQRYFVGFLNEAEIRGTGGLPGAFIIVQADHGVITTIHRESDTALQGVSSGITPTQEFRQLYGAGRSWSLFGNSTMSPNFPDVAAIWAGMWQRKSGERIDGAIAVDPTALSYLLAVAGPTRAPDGTPVTAANVVALTQKDVYAKYAGSPSDPLANQKRKEFLLAISSAAEGKILSGSGSLRGLVDAISRAAGERRVVAWSSNPTVQNTLSTADIGGVVPLTPYPYTGVVVQNAAANKLAYYLDRSLTYRTTSCASTRDVTVTITLTNRAPTSGLSDYASGGPNLHGVNKLVVQVYSTLHASLQGATLDGKPWKLGRFLEQRHKVYLTVLTLQSGVPQTLVLHLRETSLPGPLTVLNPPAVRPMTVSVVQPHCG